MVLGAQKQVTRWWANTQSQSWGRRIGRSLLRSLTHEVVRDDGMFVHASALSSAAAVAFEAKLKRQCLQSRCQCSLPSIVHLFDLTS